MKKTIALFMMASLAAGCATTGANYNPIVDRPNAGYSQDLRDCQAHATRVLSAGEGAAVGAVAGAIFGALLMAAGGGSQRDGAWVGALVGGVSAADDAEGGQRGIITRCLTGRGHMVLQ